MRLYIDTNIFISLFEGKGPPAEPLTELFVSSWNPALPFLVTSELTLSELLVLPYAQNRDSLIQIYENWTTSGPAIEVVPVVRDVLRDAAIVRAQHKHLKLPDAIYITTAIGTRCSHLLTSDERIRDHYTVSHARYGLQKGPFQLEVLRPTEAIISNIVERLRDG